jgi:hypothetical protein
MTEGWRDGLDLEDAERRARVLEQANMTGYSKPKTDAEDFYQNTFKEVEAALKRKDDRGAAKLWRSFQEHVTHDGRQDRGWALLAKSRAEGVERGIGRRRQTVEDLLAQATIAPQFADSELARNNSRKILQDVIDRFGDYPDVADHVTEAKQALAALKPAAASESTPPPDPAPKS